MTRELPEVTPPDAAYVKQRWIPATQVEWAKSCDRIMVDYGSVRSRNGYEKRHVARRRAQKLIRLMSELRLHERWELGEHTEKRDGQWYWAVEYLGRKQ